MGGTEHHAGLGFTLDPIGGIDLMWWPQTAHGALSIIDDDSRDFGKWSLRLTLSDSEMYDILMGKDEYANIVVERVLYYRQGSERERVFPPPSVDS